MVKRAGYCHFWQRPLDDEVQSFISENCVNIPYKPERIRKYGDGTSRTN